jgi:hypothetical protein
MRRLGMSDRRELARAIAKGQLRARWRGRERQVALPPQPDSPSRELRSTPPAGTGKMSTSTADAPSSEKPESGLSREEASILSEPVSAPGAEQGEPRTPRRRSATHIPPPIAHLDRDMRRLRDRVETIAESIEKLSASAVNSARRDAPRSLSDGDSDGSISAARFGEVCERIEELKRTVAFASAGEKRLVVEATVIPPGRGAGAEDASRRTDPFSELRSRPSPAPDYRPESRGPGARFARLLVALAIIAFSFLTGTLILAFV